MASYTIYTDGSSRRNGASNSKGGCAFACYNSESKSTKRKIAAKSFLLSEGVTNNHAELAAVWFALLAIKTPSVLQIRTDSTYVINAFSDRNSGVNKWIAKDCPNKGLLMAIATRLRMMEKNGFIITFDKVGAHGDDSLNNLVDKLARNANSKSGVIYHFVEDGSGIVEMSV